MSYAKDRLFNDWKTKEVAYRAYLARERITYAGRRRLQRGFIINPYAFGAGAATDPYFSSVVLLAHCDGSGSGNLADSSSYARTITQNGTGCSQSAAYLKFNAAGVGVGKSISATNFYTTADSAELRIGANDATVEGWFYWDSVVTTHFNPVFVGKRGAATNIEFEAAYFNTKLYFYYSTDGTTLSNVNVSWTPSTATWYHIAFSKNGTSLRFFVNGTQQGTTQTLSSATLATGTAAMTLLSDGQNSITYSGRMDDARVTNGVGRYTSNFTAPTQAFPDS